MRERHPRNLPRAPFEAGPVDVHGCCRRLGLPVDLVQVAAERLPIEPGDVVVSSHACGALTDRILERAAAAGARVSVLPCCHDLDRGDDGGLSGWLDGPLAIDVSGPVVSTVQV